MKAHKAPYALCGSQVPVTKGVANMETMRAPEVEKGLSFWSPHITAVREKMGGEKQLDVALKEGGAMVGVMHT